MYIEKEQVSRKSAAVAAVLCLFFGSLGLHRFYVGKFKSGLLYLLFGSSMVSIHILSRLDIVKGTLIGIFLFLLVAVGVFYDLFAMYNECFLDKEGKILLSGARQDELVGRTFQEKENDSLTIQITIVSFVIISVLYFVFMSIV